MKVRRWTIDSRASDGDNAEMLGKLFRDLSIRGSARQSPGTATLGGELHARSSVSIIFTKGQVCSVIKCQSFRRFHLSPSKYRLNLIDQRIAQLSR